MPFYDYHCPACRHRVSLFWPSIRLAREASPRCPQCQSPDIERIVSRFRLVKGRARSGDDDLPFDESDLADLEREDPRAMARLFRRMSDETGEGLDPDMDEVVTRLERGEDPEAIESSMGHLMGEEGSDDEGSADE